MTAYDALLKPLKIRNMVLRNRFLSTSHQPGYTDHGKPTERLTRYHVEKAKGGIGLTQLGAAVVGHENGAHMGQLEIRSEESVPIYKDLATRIHAEGAGVTVQLFHGGRRERWDIENWMPAYSPGAVREPVHRSIPKAMEDFDIERVQADYVAAALRAQTAGLDGVELSFSSFTLVEQFWSPETNTRTDRYGGSLENRMRFGLETLARIRAAVDNGFAVGFRMTGDEMFPGGLTREDCLTIAREHARSGLADFISIVGATPRDYVGTAKIWPSMWMGDAPFLHLASGIKAEVDIPIFHASRITDLATAVRAVEEGHVDMIGMTRAFIADPHFPKKLMEGRQNEIRQCVGATLCIDRTTLGQDALCVQNAATSRESTIPHVHPKTQGQKKRVVVVGGGPGGLEAARVTAERGHDVVLFEKDGQLGGQINLATKLGWRAGLSGITRWLEDQIRRKGVDVRLGTAATASMIEAENPDAIIVATGGRPQKEAIEGQDFCVTGWDILSGRVNPAPAVLMYDNNGGHQGPTVAEFMAERGSQVELVTPEPRPFPDLGATLYPPHLANLYKRHAVVTTQKRLVQVYLEDNKLVAVLRNEFAQDQEEERVVDQIVIENGTQPVDDLYFALKPTSRNLGAIDIRKMAAHEPQDIISNPEGRYALFRIGDAVAGRSIYAAIYDAARLCKDL